MSRLRTIEPKVKEALINNPRARKDDFILILEVYKLYDTINSDTKLYTALINHKQLGLPSFASIIRIRRKLQQDDPSLCDAATVEERAEAEADYVDYVRDSEE